MQAIIDTQRFKNTMVVSPGLVGSVGDALGAVRLRQSAPDMALRYQKAFSGPNEVRLGSNVQDGYSYSYGSCGGPARTLDSKLERSSFKTCIGWIHQDLRAPDKSLGERVGSTGRYDWYNRVANTYEAKRTGDMFLPLPGPYGPTSMTRGSQVPRIVARDYPRSQPPHPSLQDDLQTVVGSICVDSNGKKTFRPSGAGKASLSTGTASNVPGTQPPAAAPPATSTPTTEEDLRNIRLGP